MKLFKLLALGFCFAASSLPSEVASSASKLTLQQCIDAALLHNRELQIQRLNPEVARLTLRASYGYYDPVFTGQGRDEEASDTGGFDPADFSRDAIYNAESHVASMGLVGILPTGLSYSLAGDFSNSFGERNGMTFDSYRVFAGLTIRQPLLRNAWIDAGRLAISINKRNLRITELGVQYLTMDVINRVQQAYASWLYGHHVKSIHERLSRARSEVLKATQRKMEQGMLVDADAKLAESQLASTEAAFLSASNLADLARNELRTLMGDRFEIVGDQILPAEPFIITPSSYDLSELRRDALAKRPDLAQLRQDIEKARIDLKYRRNQLFPSLDLIAGYGRKGASVSQSFPPVQADASGYPAFSQVRDGTSPNEMVGIIFSVPLGHVRERAQYRASKELKEQAILRLKQLEELALRQVTDAFYNLESSLQRLKAAARARDAAKAVLAAEERKLASGLSTLFFVIQFQNDVASAEILEARSKADYLLAKSQLRFFAGHLLEDLGIIYHFE